MEPARRSEQFNHFGRFSAGAKCGLSDAQLLERFVSSSGESAESAFEALVLRHGPMVFEVCYRFLGNSHDVQDALQSTFMILAVKAGSIRRQESIASWLYGVPSGLPRTPDPRLPGGGSASPDRGHDQPGS